MAINFQVPFMWVLWQVPRGMPPVVAPSSGSGANDPVVYHIFKVQLDFYLNGNATYKINEIIFVWVFQQ